MNVEDLQHELILLRKALHTATVNYKTAIANKDANTHELHLKINNLMEEIKEKTQRLEEAILQKMTNETLINNIGHDGTEKS